MRAVLLAEMRGCLCVLCLWTQNIKGGGKKLKKENSQKFKRNLKRRALLIFEN